MLLRRLLTGLTLIVASGAALAQAAPPNPPELPPVTDLPSLADGMLPFAVEFRTGPAWQADKPAAEQAHFRAHSANLRRLRDARLLLLGARIGDRGFIVIAARDEAAARAEFDADPAVKAGVFSLSLQPMQVFYGGILPAATRR